jgi:hypothetical protein
MNSLNIDFRDGCLRILAAKDGSVKYTKFIKNFSLDDQKTAKETLASAIKDAGGKRGTVHVILPSELITEKTFQIPSMEFGDAKKYIKRELLKETKGDKFVYGIRKLFTPQKAPGDGQHIIAEYVNVAHIGTYLGLLNSCGLSPEIMTSGLEGALHLLNSFRPVTEGNEAVCDIGTNTIEVTVMNNSQLLEYRKIPIPHAHDEKSESEDPAARQTDKIKMYRIVDTLYKFIMAYGQDFPQENLSTLWICGIGSTIEGIADSLSDGLGINCGLIDAEAGKGNAFSALKGISALKRKDAFINLVPEDFLTAKTQRLKRLLLAASLSFYIILLAGTYIALDHTEKGLKMLYDRVAADQAVRVAKHKTDDVYTTGQATFAKIVLSGRGIYRVLRDLANLTPEGVTLTGLQVKKVQNATHIEINATIQYTDENFKDALLSRFLGSLDRSSGMKRTLPPEIVVSQPAVRQKDPLKEMPKVVLVKATYEVVR